MKITVLTIILLQQNDFYTGTDARQIIGAEEGYNDKQVLYPPDLRGKTKWKRVFLQTRSYYRQLKPNTYFIWGKI